MGEILIFFITMYRKFISPYVGNRCRFYPSCSEYAIESLTRFGVFRGSFLAIMRILRCHPWSKGGFDPVPERI